MGNEREEASPSGPGPEGDSPRLREREAAIRRVDRYELLEQVGSGGMAVVYRGRDTALDREVAVKLLHPHLAQRAESRARFSREARAVARLAHPNILEIFDYAGGEAGESYLVTEFIRGRTLRAFAEEVGIGYPEIAALVTRALADALVHAHSAGVIHRDIKPENVMVSEASGRAAVKLADFGIARILASDDRMTMTGALVGSPNHMAPEIIEGREADARSDVFSLGTLLYWLATGQLPFAAPNPTATLRRVIGGDYQDPRLVSPLVSDALTEVIRRALASDPAARYLSAAAFRDALDRVLSTSGLNRPEEELNAFLADPAGYKAAFPARLVATLMARGEEAMRDGATARALSCFNRVLAIEPENAGVAAQLDRLARRARLRRWARRALLAGLVAAGLAGLGAGIRVQMRRHRAAEAAAEAARRAAPPTPVVSPSAPPAKADAVPPAPAQGPESSPRPARAAAHPEAEKAGPTAARPRPARREPAAIDLAVHVRPYAQRALLDGVEVAHGEQRVTFSLAPGRAHVIQIEHACCVPFVKKIDAAEAAQLGELKVPLTPRPARLRVEATPETRIYLSDRFLGTAADSQRAPIQVAVPQGESPYEGKAEIRLEQPGKPPYTAAVTVRAGGDITVAAPRAEDAP